MECHDDGNFFGIPEFAVYNIGLKLTDDHPVGVTYPDPSLYDFEAGMIQTANLAFFDNDGDGRADTNEIRLYSDGTAYRVECASCHDPHGVPESGNSGPLLASFLRVDSDGSTICLSCHVK